MEESITRIRNQCDYLFMLRDSAQSQVWSDFRCGGEDRYSGLRVPGGGLLQLFVVIWFYFLH